MQVHDPPLSHQPLVRKEYVHCKIKHSTINFCIFVGQLIDVILKQVNTPWSAEEQADGVEEKSLNNLLS